MKLSGHTILITGGASGIGYSLAKAFLKRNNTVIICGRNTEKLARTKEHLPSLVTMECDITCTDAISELQAQLAVQFPELDMLINNAGIQQTLQFTDATVDERRIEEEINTNFTGHVLLTNRLLPLLTANRSSAIVFTGSALGQVAKYSQPVYCATKAAIHSFATSLRHQLAGTGTNVFEIIPDLVATPMTANRESDKKMSAHELAQSVLKKLEKDDSEILIGRTRLLLNIKRYIPGLAHSIINKGI